MAIERQRIEANLRAALERNQLLLKEVNHRVNNSLVLVASMLHLKSLTVGDEVKVHLPTASPLSPVPISVFTRLRSSRKLTLALTLKISAKTFQNRCPIAFFREVKNWN
jgi:hypothetical protein